MKNEVSVYILVNKEGRYYVGSTTNLARRMKEHKNGMSRFTSRRGPWKLVFHQNYATLGEARRVEYALKRLKRKDIITRIIDEKCITLGD